MQIDNQAGRSDSAPLHRDLPFQLGDWFVNPQTNQLHHGDSSVKLEPKVMDVLIYLAMHPGQVVSREELEEHVWAGRIVTYDALTATIVKLRKALHTAADSEAVIKTIPKRGYSLVAPIHQPPVNASIAAPLVDAHTETDAQQITQPLAGQSALSNRFEQATQEPVTQFRIVNRRYVLVGVAIGVVVLISLFLSLVYLPRLTTQQETHQPSLQHRGTTDVQALNAFNTAWKKIHNDTPQDYKDAIALLDRAILLDPDYGLAHAALAKIYWNIWLRNWHILVGTAPLPHTWELVDASLQRALKSPTPLAYSVSSEMLYTNRHYEQAVAEARKAIALAPGDPLAHAALAKALVFAGFPAQAKQSIDKALQLNPQSPPDFLFTLGLIHFNSGQYQQAIAVLEQAVYADPQNHLIYVPLIAAYGLEDRQDAVAPLLNEANRLRKLCQLPLLNVSMPINPYANNPWPFKRPGDVNRLQNGLRAAGLPEW